MSVAASPDDRMADFTIFHGCCGLFRLFKALLNTATNRRSSLTTDAQPTANSNDFESLIQR